ncbi:MAG: hypothetical protein WKF73_18455 [Nocardioidaceae bacterium]
MAHGNADAGQATPRSKFYDQGKFGRLFPSLPPFSADTPLVRGALAELGAPGGPMDAQDDLSDPIALITDPAKSADNPNNPTLTAGFTFVGQFLDHDMTFDPTSSLARTQDPESIRNFRIPVLDLDSVYGGGPGVSPHLYDQGVDGGRTKFLTEKIPGSAAVSIDGQARRDLARNSQSVALIADPRNDENLIVCGLQLAMLRFHNQILADVKADLGSAYTVDEIFARDPTFGAVALPVDGAARVPAENRRSSHREGRGQARPEVLRLASQPVYPGGVLCRRVSFRPFTGAPELPRQLRHQRNGRQPAVLRSGVQPVRCEP